MNTNQALRDLLASIDLRWPHPTCDGYADREALAPCIEKAEAVLSQFENMTDEVKTAVLKASLLNIGRLLPPDMEIHFYRDGADPGVRMQFYYADGTNIEYAFVGHGPVFDVPLPN